MSHHTGTLRFADFELDFARRELRKGSAPVALQPTPLRVLLYLAEHRDRTVPRRELLDAIWPGVVVGDESLTTALAEARRAVGDDGTAQRVIRTQKGAGYRFVARAAEAKDRSLAARPTSRAPVIAVLRFQNLTGDRSLDPFSDGLTEQVAAQLATRVNALGPAPVLASPDEPDAVRKARSRLGATHLLTGAVRRLDGMLRISGTIVSTSSGRTLCSKHRNYAETGLLAAQTHFAGVATSAAYEHLPWEVSEDPVRNEAIELTKMGQLLSWRGSPERGIELLHRALALDPTIPRTHLFLAYSASNALDLGKRTLGEALQSIDAHTAEISRLSPGSADAHSAATVGHVYRFEWPEAEAHARAAYELGGSPVIDGTCLVAIALATGRPHVAYPIVRCQIELEPADPSRCASMGSALLMDRRFVEAERALERLPGSFPLSPRDRLLSIARWLGGRRERFAEDVFQAAIANGDEAGAAEIRRLKELGGAEAVASWYARKGGYFDAMEPPFARSQRSAVLHAIAGNQSAALAALETMEPSYRAPEILFWPIFDAMRSKPRFLALVEKYRVTPYHDRYLTRPESPLAQ